MSSQQLPATFQLRSRTLPMDGRDLEFHDSLMESGLCQHAVCRHSKHATEYSVLYNMAACFVVPASRRPLPDPGAHWKRRCLFSACACQAMQHRWVTHPIYVPSISNVLRVDVWSRERLLASVGCAFTCHNDFACTDAWLYGHVPITSFIFLYLS
jgi:hypothetical protein